MVGNLEHLVRDRYESQADAASAWGMDPSMLCRILGGHRSPRRWLPAIAKVEEVPEEWFYRPQLNVLGKGGATSSRFEFNVSDPVRMLLQLEAYFADVPEGRVTTVVKAVMRTLLDEFFGEVHPPTEEWRLVLNRLQNLTPVRKALRRS